MDILVISCITVTSFCAGYWLHDVLYLKRPKCPDKPKCMWHWGELEAVKWVDPGEGSIGPIPRSAVYQQGECLTCGRVDTRQVRVR